MIELKEIDESNLEQCSKLTCNHRYVGETLWNLALAYINRENVIVQAIYDEDIIFGMVSEVHKESKYSFTDLIIDDKFKEHGFGTAGIKVLIEKLKNKHKNTLQISLICMH